MKNIFFIVTQFLSTSLLGQDIKEIDNLIASERFEDGINSLKLLQKNEPQNPYVYFGLGEAVLKSYINDPYTEPKNIAAKKAKGYFLQGTKSDSLNPINYVGLGMVELFKSNDSLKADTYFKKAYNLIPTKKKKINDVHIKTLLKLETSELYSSTPRYYKSGFYYNKLKDLRPKLPELYIANGDVLMAQSNASEAITNYKKALYIENNPLSNVLVGRIYFLARNNDEAINYYRAALQIDSLFAPAYKGLGDVYYQLHKNNLAKINYSRFIQLAGNNIPAKISYVNALYKSKDYEGAINNAEDILKVDSAKLYLYRLIAYSAADKPNPDMTTALLYIQKFFSKSPEDELIVKDYTHYSDILLSLKRDSAEIRKGVEMLEKAYLAEPTNEALVNLIKTSYTYKVYDIEIKYLTKKINSGSNITSNYMLLGKAYFYNKSYDKADSIFQLITKTDTTNVEAYKWESYSLLPKDPELKEGLAKPVFEKILKLTDKDENKYLPERYEAYTYLGSCYMFSKEADFNKAINYIKESINVDTHNEKWRLKGYYTLAYAYYKSRQWMDAKNAYEKVLQLKPGDVNATKALKDLNKYLTAQNN